MTGLLNFNFTEGDIILGILILIIVCAFSYCIYNCYSNDKEKKEKKRVWIFCALTCFLSVMMMLFFGIGPYSVRGIIFILILLCASGSDFKTRECDDKFHLMTVICGLIGREKEEYLYLIAFALLMFAFLFILDRLTKNHLGGADIKLCTAAVFVLGILKVNIGLICGLLIAIAENYKKKEYDTGFPLIPYLSIGFIISYFL